MAGFVDLVSASVRQKNTERLALIPDILLDDFEIKAKDWIVGYAQKFGVPPSAKVVEADATAKLCFSRKSIFLDEPLKSVHQGAIDWLVERYVKRNLAALAEGADGVYPVHQLLALAKTASSVSTIEHDTFLKMDRDAIYSQEVLEGGVDWGFSYLDEATGGILPGEVALLGARTGVGKSLIVCRQAVRWAKKGKRVMVVSAEMPAVQLTYRMDAMLGGFNPRLFRDRSASAKLKGLRADVELELSVIKDVGGDILFPRERQLTMENLVASCHDQAPDVLIVDGVYLVQLADRNISSSWEKTKTCSNMIKQLTLDLNIPTLTTSQFKRTGKDEGFDLEDIAYSDALGQDSDIVIAASRENPTSRKINLEIIKSRNGETGGGVLIENNWDKMTVVEVPWAGTPIHLGA